MSTSTASRRYGSAFESKFDPLNSCRVLEQFVRGLWGADYCRLDVATKDPLVSVTFEDGGNFRLHRHTQNSCAWQWRHRFPNLLHFVENDASTLGQPLCDEWRGSPQSKSFLSFRLFTDPSRQPIWGTLTLAHHLPSRFKRMDLVGQTFQLMDAFLRNAQTGFLTDVSQMIHELESSESLKSCMEVLHGFYLKHTPILSVSVAVSSALTSEVAQMFARDQPTLGEKRKQMRHFELDLEKEQTLFSQCKRTGISHPVERRVPTPAEKSSHCEDDLSKILTEYSMTPACFWILPLIKPSNFELVGSFSEQPGLCTMGADDKGFVGVVYLHGRNARVLGQVGMRAHSISPIIALILSRKPLSTQERLKELSIQEKNPRRDMSVPRSTEMTERMQAIIEAMKRNKIEDRQLSHVHPLESLGIESVLSHQSSSGSILMGVHLQKPVVIKVLPVVQRLADVPRLRLELAISRCVSHPNIVKSYLQQMNVPGPELLQCCARTGNSQLMAPLQEHLSKKISSQSDFQNSLWDVIVMEHCDFGTLDLMIHQRHVFRDSLDMPGLRSLLLTMLEMAEALDYLHNTGIVHGDFKPENVLVVSKPSSVSDPRGWCVKVADFGTCRVLGYNEGRCPPAGTCAYRPPEFMVLCRRLKKQKHEDGVAGDVYSFGIAFWEMMESKRPFENCTSLQLQDKVTNGFRPNLTVQCPPECRRLLEKCWHHAPDQRPKFCIIVQEIKDMLRTYCSLRGS